MKTIFVNDSNKAPLKKFTFDEMMNSACIGKLFKSLSANSEDIRIFRNEYDGFLVVNNGGNYVHSYKKIDANNLWNMHTFVEDTETKEIKIIL